MPHIVTYRATGVPEIPAEITIDGHTTPVWLQKFWETGSDVYYIQHNGCGHCCAAMAATLHGVPMNPEQEYARCVELWGQPGDGQDHFQSVAGITKILRGLGIRAEYTGIPADGMEEMRLRLRDAMENGRQVIFWSHPSERLVPNPFSTGEHYVMAVGYDENGGIVIANSGNRVTGAGAQVVNEDTVLNAMFVGADPLDMTWGEPRHLDRCGGVVFVG